MARLCVAALLAAVAGLACGDAPSTPPGQLTPWLELALPIGGEMNRDWFLTNYVDQVSGPGAGDYHCGSKSYDGHRGTDLVLSSFAAMDEGVAVLAAAAGTVLWTRDGEPDRNKSWIQGAQWNAVGIDHGHGYHAWYGHLMRNSVRVVPGQRVEAGDTLGLVGSSGVSDMPHLHFELRREDEALDPFTGACGPQVSHWAGQIPYQDGFRLIDAGLTTDSLTLDRVKDPPTPVDTIQAGGGTLYAWVHYHNVPTGSVTRWTIRRPDGSVHRDQTRQHTFYSMSWWWYYTSLADFQTPGEWTVEFRHEGALVAVRPLVVLAAPGPTEPVAPGVTDGYGEGWIR